MKRIIVEQKQEISLDNVTDDTPVVVFKDDKLVGFVAEDQECEWSLTDGRISFGLSAGMFFASKEGLCRVLIEDGFTLFAGEVGVLESPKTRSRSKLKL